MLAMSAILSLNLIKTQVNANANSYTLKPFQEKLMLVNNKSLLKLTTCNSTLKNLTLMLMTKLLIAMPFLISQVNPQFLIRRVYKEIWMILSVLLKTFPRMLHIVTLTIKNGKSRLSEPELLFPYAAAIS